MELATGGASLVPFGCHFKSRNSLKYQHFSKISKFKFLDFGCNCIFFQTKIFETNAYRKVCEATISWWSDAFWGNMKHFSIFLLIFRDFSKSNIFDIFDFPRKLTICPNDLGETRESLSWLDLSIPRLDISPTHAGNRTFCAKNRNFSYISRNSHIWSRINKIELHQQNSILLM